MKRGDKCRSCGRPWSGRFHGAHAPHPGRLLQAECLGCGGLTSFECESCGWRKFEVYARECSNGSQQLRFRCASCHMPPSFTVSLPAADKRNKLRRLVVADGPVLCASCHAVCEPDGVDVDHVVPLAKGGADALSNVRVLCRACHVQKTDADGFSRAALALAGGLRP